MFLNVIELAESFGVEESVVEHWVRHEALPCVPDRGRLLFDRAQVVTWAASRGLAAKAGFLTQESHSAGVGARLQAMLRVGGIWREVAAVQVMPVLEQVVDRVPGAPVPVRQLLRQRLHQPQAISWAPIGKGIALPHLRSPVALGRDAGTLACLLLRDALHTGEPAPDDLPITRLLFFIAPSPRAHLEMLGQLSAVLVRGGLRELLLAGAPDEAFLTALAAIDGAVAKGARS